MAGQQQVQPQDAALQPNWPGIVPVSAFGNATPPLPTPFYGSMAPLQNVVGMFAPHLHMAGSRVPSPGMHPGLTYSLPHQDARFHFSEQVIGTGYAPTTDELLTAFMPGCEQSNHSNRSSDAAAAATDDMSLPLPGMAAARDSSLDGLGSMLPPLHTAGSNPNSGGSSDGSGAPSSLWSLGAVPSVPSMNSIPSMALLNGGGILGRTPPPSQPPAYSLEAAMPTSAWQPPTPPLLDPSSGLSGPGLLPPVQIPEVTGFSGFSAGATPPPGFPTPPPAWGAPMQAAGFPPGYCMPQDGFPPMGPFPVGVPSGVAAQTEWPMQAQAQWAAWQQLSGSQAQFMPAGMPPNSTAAVPAASPATDSVIVSAAAAAPQPLVADILASPASAQNVTPPAHVPQPQASGALASPQPQQQVQQQVAQMPNAQLMQMQAAWAMQQHAMMQAAQQQASGSGISGGQPPQALPAQPGFPYGMFWPQQFGLQGQMPPAYAWHAQQMGFPLQQQQQPGVQPQPQPQQLAQGQQPPGPVKAAEMAQLGPASLPGPGPAAQSAPPVAVPEGARASNGAAIVPDAPSRGSLRSGSAGSGDGAAVPQMPPMPPSALMAGSLMPPPMQGGLGIGLKLTRAQRVDRYREKKARRCDASQVRYVARQANAHKRPRIKGRFVKAEELADYLAAHPDAKVPSPTAAAAVAKRSDADPATASRAASLLMSTNETATAFTSPVVPTMPRGHADTVVDSRSSPAAVQA